jgi:hypothetical protein
MKICSWDVGIKNLSYCIIEKINETIEIKKWSIIDIHEDNYKNLKCCGFFNKKKKSDIPKNCTHNPKYYLNKKNVLIGYCEVHKKKYIPFTEEWLNNIVHDYSGKETCSYLYPKKNKLCNKNTKIKFTYDGQINYYCKPHSITMIAREKKKLELIKIKKKKCTGASIESLAKKMYTELDKIPELLDVQKIYIENQPSEKNPTMKTVSSILFSYFILRGIVDKKEIPMSLVTFASALNKLKIDKEHTIKELEKCNSPREKYLKRKELAITYCNRYLTKHLTWKTYFDNSKKKDDLADSFLQGYYYLLL